MLIGGEPGGGKSVALQLIVAHGALSPDCRLILVDGKRVELGPVARLRRTVHRPLHRRRDRHPALAAGPDRRAHRLAAGPQDAQDHPRPGLAGLPDARSTRSPTTPPPSAPPPSRRSSTPATATSSPAAGHRASSPSRPPSGPRPTSSPPRLRDLFGYRWAFRCSTEAILRHHPGPRLGQRRATRPPRSTRKPAGCPGCAPRTASPAGSRPPTSPMSRSSTWPPGPPRPAPPTTPADHATPADGKVVRLRRDGDAA